MVGKKLEALVIVSAMLFYCHCFSTIRPDPRNAAREACVPYRERVVVG